MNKTDFLSTIENFLKRTNISATSLGVKALKDTRFVFMLRKGRECREATQEQVLRWMQEYEENDRLNIDIEGGINV